MRLKNYILLLTLAYVICGALWVVFSDVLVDLLFPAADVVMVSVAKGMAFVGCTAVLFLLALRSVAYRARSREPIASSPVPVLLAVALVLAGTVAGTGLAYRSTMATQEREHGKHLAVFVSLQAEGIAQYDRQQETSARSIAASPLLATALDRWRASGDPADRAALSNLLGEEASALGFAAVELVDAKGGPLASTRPPTLPPGLDGAIAEAVRTGLPATVPLWKDVRSQRYRYAILAPVSDRPGTFVLLALDAGHFLFPYLAHWLPLVHDNAEVFLMKPGAGGAMETIFAVATGGGPPAAPAPAISAGNLAGGGSHLAHAADGGAQLLVVRPVPGLGAVLAARFGLADARATAKQQAALVGLVMLAFLCVVVAVALSVLQRQKLRRLLSDMAQQRALDAAETRFRATFEQAAVGILHLSPDGDALRVNQTLCDILGYSRDELMRLHYTQLRHPDDLGDEAEVMAALVRGDIPHVTTEKRHLRKDGSIVWLSCTSSLVRDEAGRPAYFIVVAKDISERRAALAALRESEERFDLAVRGADEGLWDWRVDTDTLYVSPRWKSLLGYGEDELQDPRAAVLQLIHPDDLPRLKALAQAVLRREAPAFEAEYRLRHKDGSYRDFRTRAFSSIDDRGEVVRVVGMHADITERKRAEAHSRLATAVFSSIDEGLVVTDLHGVVTAVNPAFSRITGYSEAEAMGQTMRLVQSGRHDRGFYQQMWQSILVAGSWSGEIWNRRKNGEVYPEHVNVSTVFDEAGKPQSYVGSFTDISAVKQSQRELDHIAHYDPLTDLPNRVLFASLVEHAVNRPRARCAVLFLDLDRFKTVNDSLGHLAGDTILLMVSRRLMEVLGEMATVSRYGGDEFVALVEDVSSVEQVGAMARRVIEAMGEGFVLDGGKEVYVGVSIGISLFPDDARTHEQLIEHADSALFHAKAHGRGISSFYTEALTRAANSRLDLDTRLRRALAQREFTLHYQPIVDIATRRIAGCEALLRWEQPGDGIILPDAFVPLAEETGLIVPLGAFALEEACRQMAAWVAAGHDCRYVAVNLSSRQFLRQELVADIDRTLAATGLAPEHLELEITESLLFQDGMRAEVTLSALKMRGVNIALDDFGTGYSSLAYLKRFPISKLKIDRAFLRDLPHSTADSEIVTAIVALGRGLGIEVLAEGIETAEQYEFLLASRCDSGQGFLFSRAVPARQFEALLARNAPLELRSPEEVQAEG